MEQSQKFYSQNAIALATYLGGPLAAGILIRRNSLNLGKEKEGLIALIVGIVSTFLLFWGIFQIPDRILDKIPNAIIPGVYAAIVYLIVEIMHGEILRKHKEEKRAFYSYWRASGIGLIGAAILLGGIFTYAYYSADDWDADAYDAGLKKLDDNEVEAMKLFDMLKESSNDQLASFIEQTGIPKWRESIEILNEMCSIENIPEEYRAQNELLLEYCTLRIEAYELILKAIQNETYEYSTEIDNKHSRIDDIIKELKKR